ncbi:hypothetical protein [Rhodanobacter sp. C03]|uniref:hypothetical protein n=1 Tax=Rhodanobacter sp. C03 TaxID=1945858 RepID=UPI0014394398|nr:hypothetical protein [Rhodanobacter sp. C03]
MYYEWVIEPAPYSWATRDLRLIQKRVSGTISGDLKEMAKLFLTSIFNGAREISDNARKFETILLAATS